MTYPSKSDDSIEQQKQTNLLINRDFGISTTERIAQTYGDYGVRT
jgi:hypothetical protein